MAWGRRVDQPLGAHLSTLLRSMLLQCQWSRWAQWHEFELCVYQLKSAKSTVMEHWLQGLESIGAETHLQRCCHLASSSCR